MRKYEWEVLMESGIIIKLMAFDPHDAKATAEGSMNYGVDYAQAYRLVAGNSEWLIY